MAAPILWAPEKMRSFCRKTYVHKIPRFRGAGGILGLGGGGKCRFYFYGRRDFSDLQRSLGPEMLKRFQKCLMGPSSPRTPKSLENGEKLTYHPFWGSPLFYKAPPRQFQPPKCKLTPSKIQIVEGRFLCSSIQKLQIGGRQSLFGGCQFTFWRVPIYIWEAEIVLGVLYISGLQKGPEKRCRAKIVEKCRKTF